MKCGAVVYGGSMGLGYHSARALAGLGRNMILVARRAAPLVRACRDIHNMFGVEAVPWSCDIRREGCVRSALEEAISRWGCVDAAVMAYGNIGGEPLELHEASWGDWMEAAALYIASTGELIRGLLEANPSGVKATVILVSSFTVIEPMSPLSVSDSVRAALSRIVRLAARRYPERLRPILILAGSFPTPGAFRTIEGVARARGVEPRELWAREVEGRSPLGRAGSLVEFERLVASVVSSPEYLTGTAILFDGSTSRVAWP